MPNHTQMLRRGPGEYPNLFSVPYPSSVHWAGGDAPLHDPTNTSVAVDASAAPPFAAPAPTGRDRASQRRNATAAGRWCSNLVLVPRGASPRPTLMLFVGSTGHGDVLVREQIRRCAFHVFVCPRRGRLVMLEVVVKMRMDWCWA